MTGFISNLKTELKGDRVIWVLISLMTLVSLLGVYSSTGSLSHKEQGGNTEYYLVKQGFIVLFGFFIMYVLHRLHYSTIFIYCGHSITYFHPGIWRRYQFST